MRDPLTNILLAAAIIVVGTAPFWVPPLIAWFVDHAIWRKL